MWVRCRAKDLESPNHMERPLERKVAVENPLERKAVLMEEGQVHRRPKKIGFKGFLMDDMPKGYSDYCGGAYLPNKNSTNQPKDVLPKSDVVQKSDTPEIIIRDTFNVAEAEDLFPARRVRFTEQVDGEQAAEGEGDQPRPKKLNFPEFANGTVESYHMVNGKKIHASSGLVGTETLRELLSSGMVPKDKVKDIAWLPSTTTVTGITGQADSALARFRIRLVLARMKRSTQQS